MDYLRIKTDLKIKDNSLETNKYSWCERDVEAFRKLVQNEKQLVSRLDDVFLLSFLRAKKFDREGALKLLKSYCKHKINHPEFFSNFNISSVKDCMDSAIMGYFMHTDQHGRIIALGRCEKWDPSKLSVKMILRAVLMFLDFLLNDHLMQVNGLVMILDAETMSLRHIIQLTPRTAYFVVSCLFKIYPVCFKEIHVVNVNRLAHAFLGAFLPFLPYKIKTRIHFHSSGMESLHKFIHPKYLPSEYGGELPSFDAMESMEVLREHDHFFCENERVWKCKNEEIL